MGATLERAIEIAHQAHDGEMRKDGRPYVTHPLRVMAAMALAGHSETTQIVAVLHDVPENNPEQWPLERLRQEGFDNEVLAPLERLTRADGLPYDEYIEALAEDPRASEVKMYDIFDNLNDWPPGKEPTEWRMRQVKKYAGAIITLLSRPRELV